MLIAALFLLLVTQKKLIYFFMLECIRLSDIDKICRWCVVY